MYHGDWGGVFAGLPSFFSDRGELNETEVATHIDRLFAAGATGLIVGGADGEGASLTPDERQTLTRLSVAKADGKRAVLVGITAAREDEATAQARAADEAGCSGLLVPPAPFQGANETAARAYLTLVARATDLPIMVDNDPSVSTLEVGPEMLADLAQENMLVAVRHGWPGRHAVSRPEALAALVDDRYLSFWGDDEFAPQALMPGLDGWISAAVNIFPEEAVALFRHLDAEDLHDARLIAHWLMPILLCLGGDSDRLAVVKFALHLLDHGPENLRSPRTPLDGEARERVRAIIETALDTRKDVPE